MGPGLSRVYEYGPRLTVHLFSHLIHYVNVPVNPNFIGTPNWDQVGLLSSLRSVTKQNK